MAEPVWSAIDAWLQQHAPEVWENLAPPATRSAIDGLAATLGQPLPVSLREAYLAHDGMRSEFGPTFFSGFRLPRRWMGSAVWCSCAQAEAGLDSARRLWGRYWPEGGVPFAAYSTSNGYFIVLPDDAVVFFDTEDGSHTPIAPSFRGWCEDLLAGIAEGKVVPVDLDDQAHDVDAPGLIRLGEC